MNVFDVVFYSFTLEAAFKSRQKSHNASDYMDFHKTVLIKNY